MSIMMMHDTIGTDEIRPKYLTLPSYTNHRIFLGHMPASKGTYFN